MSQTVVTKPCYGAIHEITCHLFIYAVPSASSNVTSAKRCGNAFPQQKRCGNAVKHVVTDLDLRNHENRPSF